MFYKVIPAALVLALVGCATPELSVSKRSSLQKENEELNTMVVSNRVWRQDLLKFEDRISRLESVVEPLAPLKEKNMALMEANAQQGEEAGGGSNSEIFYLVQTAYSELDMQAANVARDINTSFSRDDFIQTYLYGQLEDKVVQVTLDIGEIVVRRSGQMAADRRLVTARLKSLHESFLALKNLSENKAFDLSYKQRHLLLQKADDIRVEYAKTLKTDYFPAIPQFIPLASGEDYLTGLGKMNEYITQASVFYKNASGKTTDQDYKDLSASLEHKKGLYKGDSLK